MLYQTFSSISCCEQKCCQCHPNKDSCVHPTQKWPLRGVVYLPSFPRCIPLPIKRYLLQELSARWKSACLGYLLWPKPDLSFLKVLIWEPKRKALDLCGYLPQGRATWMLQLAFMHSTMMRQSPQFCFLLCVMCEHPHQALHTAVVLCLVPQSLHSTSLGRRLQVRSSLMVPFRCALLLLLFYVSEVTWEQCRKNTSAILWPTLIWLCGKGGGVWQEKCVMVSAALEGCLELSWGLCIVAGHHL